MPISVPFARVGLDLMGLLKTTELGHRFVSVAIDYFTEWMELQPLPSKDCEGVAQFFFDEIISRYGSPTRFSLIMVSNSATHYLIFWLST